MKEYLDKFKKSRMPELIIGSLLEEYFQQRSALGENINSTGHQYALLEQEYAGLLLEILGDPQRNNRAATPEPDPVEGKEEVPAQVIRDILARREQGERKYGTVLKTFNGRHALWDAYQEQIDFLLYLRQWLMEDQDIEKLVRDGNLYIGRGQGYIRITREGWEVLYGTDGGNVIISTRTLFDAIKGLVEYQQSLERSRLVLTCPEPVEGAQSKDNDAD